MSIEVNLERIATALEIIALAVNDDVRGKAETARDNLADTTEGEDTEERPKAVRKKAASKKKAAAKKTAEEEPAGPTREEVQTALVSFCKDGPGKEAAKGVLQEFNAGSISTLDAEEYGAFIARLDEVNVGG